MPTHRHLSRRATLAAFPGLRPDAVRGAIRYWDAQVDDARHTLAVVRTAAGYGARVLSSARVVGLLRDGEGPDAPVVGVRSPTWSTAPSFQVRARSVVAATGVWSDDIGAMLGVVRPRASGVRASKGVHLVVPRDAIDAGSSPRLRADPADGDQRAVRHPLGRPLDRRHHRHPWRLDRAHPAACSADIDYLLDQVNRVLSGH